MKIPNRVIHFSHHEDMDAGGRAMHGAIAGGTKFMFCLRGE
ncbi:MAG: hypothetical protein WAW41_18115 [Methylobacter sp.]